MPRYDFDRVASKTLADEGGANVSDDIHPSERMDLFAEPVAEQERLVDCDGRLGVLSKPLEEHAPWTAHVATLLSAGCGSRTAYSPPGHAVGELERSKLGVVRHRRLSGTPHVFRKQPATVCRREGAFDWSVTLVLLSAPSSMAFYCIKSCSGIIC
jgi:hypothetical protein